MFYFCFFLIRLAHSVRAFCFGRRVCLSVPHQISKIKRDLSEISLPILEIGVAEQDMTSDFSPEVAKYPKVVQNPK